MPKDSQAKVLEGCRLVAEYDAQCELLNVLELVALIVGQTGWPDWAVVFNMTGLVAFLQFTGLKYAVKSLCSPTLDGKPIARFDIKSRGTSTLNGIIQTTKLKECLSGYYDTMFMHGVHLCFCFMRLVEVFDQQLGPVHLINIK